MRISRINNTQIDDAQYNDVVMPIYNLRKYGNNYSKVCGILRQNCSDVPDVDNDAGITHFTEGNSTIALLSLKEKLAGQIDTNGTKNVNIKVPLKNLSNFWRTLEMLLINCEITFFLCWSENYRVIVATNVAAQASTFSITDAKLFLQTFTRFHTKILQSLDTYISKGSWDPS